MKLGVIANIRRRDAKSVVKRVINWCRANDQEYYLSDELKPITSDDLPFIPKSDLVKQCNCLLAMGGDGTMLSAARLVGNCQIPILGINIGSLGFLTEQTPDDLEPSLEKLKHGNFGVEDRIILEGCLNRKDDGAKYYALNEFVIDKGRISRMITLSLYANDDYICSYNADGLIISSPTGSTAYSLAVGGPILNPTMKAMIASPIAPHSLASRPLIFPHTDLLEIKIDYSHEYAILTVDGQVDTKLPTGSSVFVRVADHVVRLVRFPENSFYSVLRSKLHWGVLPKLKNDKDIG